MKTKELNALKEEIEAINEKCRELTDEELEQVSGGVDSKGMSFVKSQMFASGKILV